MFGFLKKSFPAQNLIIALGLVLFSYAWLYSIGSQFFLKTSFIVFLFAAIFLLAREILIHFDRRASIFVILVQVVTLAILFPNLLRTELWGDEIGVIDFASLPFTKISDAASDHAAVPPFDYWMLHVWIKTVQFLDIPPYYNEFILRLPYFMIHSLSSFYFALLVHDWFKKHRFQDFIFFKHRSLKENALPVIAALFFFFNPFLLFYGLEVRYYATVVLGVVTTLYFFLNHKFGEPAFLVLSLLFGLNSVFHFIFLFPLLLFQLWKNKTWETLIFAGMIGVLFLQVEPRLDYMEIYAITADESWERIKSSFLDMHYSTFVYLEHLLTVLFSLFLFLKHRGKQKDMAGVFMMVAYLFLAVAIPSYLKRYFDFHQRHFLVVVPFYLLLFFYPLHIFKKEQEQKLYGGWLLFLTFLWVVSIFFTHTNFPHKTNLGAKKMFNNIGYHRSLLVYFEPATDQQVLGFNKFAYEWYKKEFGFTSTRVISEEMICQNPCLDQNVCVVVTGKYEVGCLTGVHGFFHEESEFSHYYYSPGYFLAD